MPPLSDRRDHAAGPPSPATRAARDGRLAGLAGIALALAWPVLVLTLHFLSPQAGESVAGTFLALLLAAMGPAVIGVAVGLHRTVLRLRGETAELREAVAAMRGGRSAAEEPAPGTRPRPVRERPAEGHPAADTPPGFATRRDGALSVPSADRRAALVVPRPDPGAEQPDLGLGTPAEGLAPPLATADFIRALQFPESAEDREGFRALRRALEDRELARLIRAAQDVLTLLSEEGIYMDDLRPEPCHPDLWRRFAAGERGHAIAAVGGIRDRASLALAAARMREDTIFRDAAHHFLRTFDRTFQGFERAADDAGLAGLADTRTARAFMLLGRVAGVFG